jgi:hypothetical protein
MRLKRNKGSAAVALVGLMVFAHGSPAMSQTAPSVPNLIAYQGLVTLAGGSPNWKLCK